MTEAKCKVGCCGWGMAQEEYYRQFELLEVQTTFYQPPQEDTARRWREEAPRDFEFGVTAWQLIIHGRASLTHRR
jgi:uncharacterized protein YecE (DUF72 family)